MEDPLHCARYNGSAISTKKGVFIFGGTEIIGSRNCNRDSIISYEFLGNGYTEWDQSKTLPAPGFSEGSAVLIFKGSILLIGGAQTPNKVLKFNVFRETFERLPDLKHGRFCHSAVVWNEKFVIISGGKRYDAATDETTCVAETEVIDLSPEGLSGYKYSVEGNLLTKRHSHQMQIYEVGGKEKVICFGGSDMSGNKITSAEEFDLDSKEWKESDLMSIETRDDSVSYTLPATYSFLPLPPKEN